MNYNCHRQYLFSVPGPKTGPTVSSFGWIRFCEWSDTTSFFYPEISGIVYAFLSTPGSDVI